jgi:hypothetical protein
MRWDVHFEMRWEVHFEMWWVVHQWLVNFTFDLSTRKKIYCQATSMIWKIVVDF